MLTLTYLQLAYTCEVFKKNLVRVLTTARRICVDRHEQDLKIKHAKKRSQGSFIVQYKQAALLCEASAGLALPMPTVGNRELGLYKSTKKTFRNPTSVSYLISFVN